MFPIETLFLADSSHIRCQIHDDDNDDGDDIADADDDDYDDVHDYNDDILFLGILLNGSVIGLVPVGTISFIAWYAADAKPAPSQGVIRPKFSVN